MGLLFQRGAFDPVTTRLTAEALLYYAVGLWAFSGVRIVVSAFYALQDTKTPVKIAVISLLVKHLLEYLAYGANAARRASPCNVAGLRCEPGTPDTGIEGAFGSD